MPPLIGQIQLFPYSFAPMGWLFCNGSQLQRSRFTALFNLLGNAFGGDGQTTFGIPDLSAATPANCHYFIAVQGDWSPDNYEAIIGETIQLPTTAPGAANLLPCAGQLYSASQYQLLASYIGNRFGDHGATASLPTLNPVAAPPYQYLIAVQGNPPNSLGTRAPLVGELILLPYSDYFPDLLPCDGSQLQLEENKALFAVIGTMFGGNVQQGQFNVPDLRAAAPTGYSYYISTTGIFPRRD